MFSHSSDSREAITETANSDAKSADDAPPDDSDDHDDDGGDETAAVDEQEASWFGMGRLGSAALSLAQGVASAIHQTAVNAAEELAEMERLAGQEAKEEEEKKAQQHERNEKDLSSTGTSALSLPLPWQVPSTAHGRGTHQESSNDDDNSQISPLVEDELLKEKIKYANRVHLYADNDSGIKLALGAVFQDWIAQHKLYAFQISAEKSGSAQYLDEDASKRLREVKASAIKDNPDISTKEMSEVLWQAQLSNRVRVGNAKSEWIINPNSKSRLALVDWHPNGATHLRLNGAT